MVDESVRSALPIVIIVVTAFEFPHPLTVEDDAGKSREQALSAQFSMKWRVLPPYLRDVFAVRNDQHCHHKVSARVAGAFHLSF
jgi:hypothetical protein